MSTPALHVDALSRRFGRSWVLQHLTFAVDAGERIMLTGPNGSGKTTLLRCLATALRPHAGAIRLDGEDLWANRRRLRQTVAMLAMTTACTEICPPSRTSGSGRASTAWRVRQTPCSPGGAFTAWATGRYANSRQV